MFDSQRSPWQMTANSLVGFTISIWMPWKFLEQKNYLDQVNPWKFLEQKYVNQVDVKGLS